MKNIDKFILPANAFFFIIVIMGTLSRTFSDAGGVYHIWLDGFNAIQYNQNYSGETPVLSPIIAGHKWDDFPQQLYIPFLATDTAVLCLLSARLGAETGDPLLNAYFLDTPRHNRDHLLKGIGLISIPRISTDLFYAYRYVDTYSDRFDTLWLEYGKAYGTRMDFDSLGLADEQLWGYRVQTRTVEAHGDVSRYAFWGITPRFFNPVYLKGYKTRHNVNLTLGDSRITSQILLDWQDRYYSHNDADAFMLYAGNIAWRQPLLARANATLSLEHDSRHDPSTNASLRFTDSVGTIFSYTVHGQIFNDLQPAGGCRVYMTPQANIGAGLAADYMYLPRGEHHTFYEDMNGTVDTFAYRTSAHKSVTCHSNIDYRDTLVFPLSCAVWYTWRRSPVWERIDTAQKIITRESDLEHSISLFGGMFSYELSFRRLGCVLWANGHFVTSGTQEPLSVPWNAGIDLELGKRNGAGFFGALTLEAVGPVTQRYLVGDDRDTAFSAPARASVSCEGRIPFLMPLLRRRISTVILVEAGPLHLSSEVRMRNHPFGNLFGPRIVLQVVGTLRARR